MGYLFKNLRPAAFLLGAAVLLAIPQVSQGVTESSLVPPTEQVSDFEARLALARLLASRAGAVDPAVREYRLLVQQRPQDPQIRLELAQLLIRQKNYPQAVSELKTVLSQRPNDPQAVGALARVYLWTANYPEAIRLLVGLRQQRPLAPDLLLDLARAYTWSKQYPQAIQTYQEVLGIQKRPQGEVYAELGDVYLSTKDLHRAVANYRKALELSPTSEAFRKKLALALSWTKQDEEALRLLVPLNQQHPADKEIGLELIRVYAKTGRQDKALAVARALLARFPQDADFLVEMADLELSLGHFRASRDLYEKALKLTGQQEKLAIHVADQMNLWGDFYKVESIYQDYLKKYPQDFEVSLKLAWALVSSQRYEEAEGLYRRLLLKRPKSVEPLLGLTKLKLMSKDFKGALEDADQVLHRQPEHPEALTLKGEALYRVQRYPEALDAYQRLARLKSQEVKGLIGAGKVFLKQGRLDEAKSALTQALKLDPKSVEASYYFHFAEKSGAAPESPQTPPTTPPKESPLSLVQLAQLYAEAGANRQAIKAYEAALEQDPQCFPAQMGLAEILGVDHQYERSLKMFQALAEEFPGNSKIWMSWARVLGWSKDYKGSLEVYEKVRQLNPRDPVPQKEMARTAAWGKMMPEARRIYASMYDPRVDQKLLESLEALQNQGGGAEVQSLLTQVRQAAGPRSVYQGYEVFSQELPKLAPALDPQVRTKLESLFLELLPAYKEQKAAFLEGLGKWQVWNKRFTPSLDTYKKLTDFQPGNQEAYFDYAQVQCALGLCDGEAATYKNLLSLDPLHAQAGPALERLKIRSNPYVRLSQTYWEETGTGEHAISQIARHRTDMMVDLPLSCAHHLRVSAIRWLEQPKERGGSYWADGGSLELTGLLNPYIKYALMWTGKAYERSSMSSRNTGYAKLWFNLRDYAQLGLGYERTDEIYNYYGIWHGTQANQGWLSLSSFLTRKLQVGAEARYIGYTDNNEEQVYSVFTSYDVTDHPRILRLKLRGEYRDTNYLNDYVFQGTTLVNIKHPYWTPQDYLGGAVSVEWYHDLSKLFFCGTELHFYALRASFITDTKGNPGYVMEGEWHYEFKKHWSLNLKGLLQRSNQWNANGAWAYIQYQF